MSISIGDLVKFNDTEGEVLSLHPLYAIVVSEGKEHRVWTKNLVISENQPKRDQIYKEAFIFKGYKTKHFNRVLAESFRDLSKEVDDEYAVLSCIKSFDYILGTTDTTIAEAFNVTRIELERLKRYSSKLGINYITEKIINVVDEELFKYAILEGIKYTTTDRQMIAKVIAMVAGINITGVDPTNIINQAAIKLRQNQLTPPGYQMLGRLLNVATKAGIRWNKDTFSQSQQTMMGLQ